GAPSEIWRELEEIHRPIAVRWADRLLEPRRHRAERVVLLFVTMSLVTAAMPLRAGLIVQAPLGTGWIVLAMACAVVVLALDWLVRRRRASGSRTSRLELLALLALGSPAVGLLSAGLTLSRVSEDGLDPWSAVEIASATGAVAIVVGVAAGVL